MSNYLGAVNPWGLAGPPQWVLDRLTLRDPDLVLLPGMTQPVYRLARRVRRSLGLMHAALGHDSETAQMIRLRLVPVTSILPGTTWGPLFQWLDDHDVWAAGGAERADVALASREATQADRQQAEQDDAAMAIGSSAWRAAQLRRGATVFLHDGSRTGASDGASSGHGG